jgi:hypothetical protein
VADAQGLIDSVSGNPTDCVYVNGSSGPCGSGSGAYSFMDGDVPSGAVNGSNSLFTLSAVPNPATSLYLYRNGLLQESGTDFTLINNNTVQFTAGSAPQTGDTLLANYRLASSTSGTPKLFPTPQVLCSGTGSTASSTSLGTLGSCTIPQGTLSAGNHVEIRFDLARQGSAGGFTYLVQWGTTTVVQRTATSTDAQVSGHADAGLDQAGA